MYTIENLNPGDAIVTQTTKHAETYKLHRYTPYTITGVSDGVAILNNGTHALMHTPEKESVYTLQELTTSYNQRTHVYTPYMTEAITWQVDIIKTFTGDTAKDEAHNHSALLNKARTLLKGVAGVSDLQRKPHTITSNMVEEVVALAGKHIQQGVKSALETLAFIRDGLNELVAADVKMRAKYNAPSAASGKLYILTNKDGEATSYGFQEGAIVEIETRHNIHTLQVHGGDNTAIHLINDTGKAIGAITLQRGHLEHAGGMATRDLYGDYEEDEVCRQCDDPEWQIDMPMFTALEGKPEHIEEYSTNGSLSFEQEAAYLELQAWQESSLRNVYNIASDAADKYLQYGFYAVHDAAEHVYDLLVDRSDIARIQRRNSALKDALDRAVVDTEHIGKEYIVKVKDTISAVAGI